MAPVPARRPGSLAGLVSPPALAALAMLVLTTLAPAYHPVVMWPMRDRGTGASDGGASLAEGVDVPLVNRFARTALFNAGYLVPLRPTENDDLTAAADPLAYDIIAGAPDFACAQTGQDYFEALNPQRPRQGQISVRDLTLAIVAAELYNRTGWDRALEVLLDKAGRLFGRHPDLSMGMAQIRPSQIRRLAARATPGLVLTDNQIDAILADRCQSIAFAALLIAGRITPPRPDAAFDLKAAIRTIAAAYVGAVDPRRRDVARYLDVVVEAYGLLVREPLDQAIVASNDPADWPGTLCLWFEPTGMRRDPQGTMARQLLHLKSPLARLIGPALAAADADGLIPVTTTPTGAIAAALGSGRPFQILYSYRSAAFLPAVLQAQFDSMQVEQFRSWSVRLGVAPEQLVATGDPGLLEAGCDNDKVREVEAAATLPVAVLGFVIHMDPGRTPAR